MSYKHMRTIDLSSKGRVAEFYSDTKAEFPSTGVAVQTALKLPERILAGSYVWTAGLKNIATLREDTDEWEWGDE